MTAVRENKIRELMKPETMDLPEFKEYLAKVQEEKRKGGVRNITDGKRN